MSFAASSPFTLHSSPYQSPITGLDSPITNYSSPITANGASLSIPLCVKRGVCGAGTANGDEPKNLREAWGRWQDNGRIFWEKMDALVESLEKIDRRSGVKEVNMRH